MNNNEISSRNWYIKSSLYPLFYATSTTLPPEYPPYTKLQTRNIKNKPIINIDIDNQLMKEMKVEIQVFKLQIN